MVPMLPRLVLIFVMSSKLTLRATVNVGLGASRHRSDHRAQLEQFFSLLFLLRFCETHKAS